MKPTDVSEDCSKDMVWQQQSPDMQDVN